MIRYGLVGCGQVATEMHLTALSCLGGLTCEAVCDIDYGRAFAVARRYGVKKVYTDLEAFLRERDRLHFVVVTTPGFTHYKIAKEAIQRGLHLFVEKPIALSYQEARELAEQAKKERVKVCVGHTYRFKEAILRARKAIDNGCLKELRTVCVVHHQGALADPLEPPWRWQEKQHKVFLYEYAIHLLDLEVRFAGPVRRIVGLTAKDDPLSGATAELKALVEHESKAVGTIDLQAYSSSYVSSIDLFGSPRDVRIQFFPDRLTIGKGRVNPLRQLTQDLVQLKEIVVSSSKAKLLHPALPRRALPHLRMYERFLPCLKGDSFEVPVTIEDTLPTMELLEGLSDAVYPKGRFSPRCGRTPREPSLQEDGSHHGAAGLLENRPTT